MLPHIMNHEDVLKAALTCDYDITLRAFRRDPLVTCSKDDADKAASHYGCKHKEVSAGWLEFKIS